MEASGDLPRQVAMPKPVCEGREDWARERPGTEERFAGLQLRPRVIVVTCTQGCWR